MTWKSSIPTQAKSAPFSKAYLKPSRGWMTSVQVFRHDLFVHYLIRFVADELGVFLESFGGLAAEQRKHRDNQDRQ
jgi:hypothetical protein